MLQLLCGAIFGEMLLILTLLFKTPLRKLVIVALDRVKRGRGPVVVTTVGATLMTVLASSLYSMAKIQKCNLEAGTVNPTDQVLMSKHMLEASLMGFVLFLSLVIDRLHHYIRELRLLRKTMEAVKKQSRSFEDGKNGNAEEHKALTEEIAILKVQVKKLKSECEVKASKAMPLEPEVEDLMNQSVEFLMEYYDRLLANTQNLRSQLEDQRQKIMAGNHHRRLPETTMSDHRRRRRPPPATTTPATPPPDHAGPPPPTTRPRRTSAADHPTMPDLRRRPPDHAEPPPPPTTRPRRTSAAADHPTTTVSGHRPPPSTTAGSGQKPKKKRNLLNRFFVINLSH